jgi:ABC-2 type transport system permease protein
MRAVQQLATAVVKETRLILRDWHALAILFVMPVVFVTILSLALRDVFTERSGATFSLLIVNQDGKQFVGQELSAAFEKDRHFRVDLAGAPFPDPDQLAEWTKTGRYKLVLVIPPKATEQARARAREQVRTGLGERRQSTPSVAVSLLSDPTLRADHRAMVQAFANGALKAVEARLIAERIADLARTPFGGSMVSAPKLAAPQLFAEITDPSEAAGARRAIAPTSVQLNAPGWTVLAMFFLAVPLSVTFIKERAQGSLLRLESMPVPTWVLFGGKIVPYVLINQIQLVLILAVGVWGLPLLGADRLTLGDAPEAIVLLGLSTSLAAIGFSLLIATISETTEQATTLSATIVLTLAALGGIMVPKFVMPAWMQQLADLTPFSWGLEGFLDLFIRGGGIRDVLREAGQLLAFAAACFIVALLRFNWQLRHQ